MQIWEEAKQRGRKIATKYFLLIKNYMQFKYNRICLNLLIQFVS